MKYRNKKEDESWNWYTIHLFHEGRHSSYLDFLDEYFKDASRLKSYEDGIAFEAVEKEEELINRNKIKKKSSTKFAKKPNRLKNKNGFLF